MTTRHTSEPSKLVIAGSSYHVNAGTIRTLVAQRDDLLAALRSILAVDNARQAHIIARAAIAKATEVQS